MDYNELIAQATNDELQEIATAFSARMWSPQQVMSHFDKGSSWFYGLAKSENPAHREIWDALEACKIDIAFAGGTTSYYLAEEVSKLEYSVQRAGALKWSPSSQPVRDTFKTLREYRLPGETDPVWPAKVSQDNYRPDTMTDEAQLAALQSAFGLTDDDNVSAHHDECERFMEIVLRRLSWQTVTEEEIEYVNSVARAMQSHEVSARKS